jgi:pyruvate dehydrogenase E1 component beta subunit
MMVERSLAAAKRLAADGIEAEVIDLGWLAPMDVAAVAESVVRIGRLVVVEEGQRAGGWGSTLLASLAMAGVRYAAPPILICLEDDLPLAFSPALEDEMLPSVERIEAAARASAAASTARVPA